jgi:PAS domain-containing protein
MNKALVVCVCIFCIMGAAFFGVAIGMMYLARSGAFAETVAINSKIDAMGKNVNDQVTKMNANLAKVTDDLGKVTDTLTDKNKGVLTHSLPGMLANVAGAAHNISTDFALEREAFVPQSNAAKAVAENASTLILNANGAVTDLRGSEQKFQAILEAIDPALVSHTAVQLDHAATEFAGITDRAHDIAGHLDNTSADIEDISDDAKDYVHGLTHPPRSKQVWNIIKALATIAALHAW